MMNTCMDREIIEARAAGIRALNSLRRAQRQLNDARSWGILDIFGGAGITGLVKHVKLDAARDALEHARSDMAVFRRELRDVDMPEIDIDEFLTFADFFFDGFLADFMVQRRINEARARVERACSEVEAVLRQLDAR